MTSRLLRPEEMGENHLLNTVKLNLDDMTSGIKNDWLKRKDECRMELIRRWVPELQKKGYKAKIIPQEPEKCGNLILPAISIDDLIDDLDLFSRT